MTNHPPPLSLRWIALMVLVMGGLTIPPAMAETASGQSPATPASVEELKTAPIDPPASRAKVTAERWDFLRDHYFGDRPVARADSWIGLEAPARVADAALVPVKITLNPPAGQQVQAVHLLVDQNPIPRAAIFRFTGQQRPPVLETRLRVDDYSNITVVAEMQDGSLWNTSRYVKASGGCSAPMTKNLQTSVARMGKMKLNLPADITADQPVTAQLLISHPNYTGLQYDQINRFYIPPHYVSTVDIRYGGEPLMTVETDISISEDPSLHFTFIPGRAGDLAVQAVDSKGRQFKDSWPIATRPAS